MKKLLLVFAVIVSAIACKKTHEVHPSSTLRLLKESLAAADFARIDPNTVSEFTNPSTGRKYVWAGFTDDDPHQDFVILGLDNTGKVSFGRIVDIEGSIAASSANKQKLVFNGSITTSSLQHTDTRSSVIREGFIMALHTSSITLNSIRTNGECYDCTIPEVIVSSSIKREDPFAWLNLFWTDDTWPKMDYLPIGGGGGGSNSGDGDGDAPPVITVDKEDTENKEKIDAKKYMDCFKNVPDQGASFTITISSDIPVDNRPDIFFNWSEETPGHVYIQLYKLGSTGLVSQTIGFYPASRMKVLTGANIPSKIVDNAGHEFNAQYSISVNATQFQAAINAVNQLSSHAYNVSTFNCVDFALGVFNAAGGGLTIPKYPIPGFPVTGGSNTPQGLYAQLESMKLAGASNININANKNYSGTSKGPCN